MMLEVIFKYNWIGMLVLIYIIWGIASIKDIINTVSMYESPSFYSLDESTQIWIVISFIITFIASFGYWLYTCVGGVE